MAGGSLFTGGGIKFPIADASITYSLFEADPLLKKLFGLLTAAINAELGKDSEVVVAGSPWATVTAGTSLDGQLPVADRCWFPPTPARLREAQHEYPLLCIYRTGEPTVTEVSTEDDVLRSALTIDYLLSPMSAADVQRIAHVCKVVADIIRLTLCNRGHPAFQGGATVLSEADFWALQFTQTNYGPAQTVGQDGEGVEFWAASVGIEVDQRAVLDESANPPLLGGSYTYDQPTEPGGFTLSGELIQLPPDPVP